MMGRHRTDAAALEARAAVHARRLEQQDDELAALRRRIAVADAEHRIQGDIIRRRNHALISLACATAWLLARATVRPERVLDALGLPTTPEESR